MNHLEVYVIAKNAGLLLYKYSIGDAVQTDRDLLMSGFLSALNQFAMDMNFPLGVSLIRSGTLEARFTAGKHVLSVLIIDYQIPLGASTEPILSGLAEDIVERFEDKYKEPLGEQIESQRFKPKEFKNFSKEIDNIIEQFSEQSHELYRKLILIESMYAEIPQELCLPMIERLGKGKRVNIMKKIPENYHQLLKNIIKKVNLENKPVWEVFSVPIIDPNEN